MLLASAAIHAAVLGGAAAWVAAPERFPERTAVWIDVPVAEVRDAMPAEPADLPVPALPDLPDPVVSDEAPPEPVLEPLAEPAVDPEDPFPPPLSLSVVGRRTKPPPTVPVPPLAPPPPSTPWVRAPRVQEPVALPRTAPRIAPAPTSLRLLHAPSFTAADYPTEARRLRIEGTALVRITIGTSGSVVDALLVRSSGSPLLDADAVAKARLYRFAPIASPRAENLPVRYRLD
jgi:protein TonB